MTRQHGRYRQHAQAGSRPRWHRLGAAVALLPLLATGQAESNPAAPQPVTEGGWIATDDAYTVSSQPNRVTGGLPKVAVGHDGWADKVGYIKFDVDRVVDGATLVLPVMSGDPGTLRVHSASTDWNEGGLTAATAPAPGDVLASVAVTRGWQVLTIDLGDHVTASGQYAFALTRQEDAGVTRIMSRDMGSHLAPQLQPAVPTVPRPGTPVPAPTSSPRPTEPSIPSPTEPASPSPTEPSEYPSPSPTPSPTSDPVPPAPSDPARCKVSEILVPSCGLWFGVGANPYGSETYDQAMINFENQIDRPVDIARIFRRGQQTVFPTPHEMTRATGDDSGNRILFYNWKPTGITWREVADGAADEFLARLGRHMAQVHPEPLMLSLHAEMESEVIPNAGSGQTAKDFRDFFRHTVKVLRENGATHVVMVVNYMGAPHWGDRAWFEDLYPGDDVVDWIGQDPYAFGTGSVWRSDFAGLVDRPSQTPGSKWPGFYTWATTNFPDKPMILSEWGVDDVADDPSYKPGFFRTTPSQLRDFPAIKALVYWDHPGMDPVGATSIHSSQASLDAFRELVHHPLLKLAGDSLLR